MNDSHAPMLTPMRTALAATLFGLAAFFTQPGFFQSIDYQEVNGLSDAYRSLAYAQGRLPFWNPHVGLGRPFLADIETQSLYPPHLLGVLLGAPLGSAVLILAHLVLAALAMRALARRLGAADPFDALAGLAFVASGSLASRVLVGQEHFVFSYCYLPAVFLFSVDVQDRPAVRKVLGLSVVLALQFLAGQPQVVWVTVLGVGCFVVGRGLERPFGPSAAKTVRCLALIGAAGIGALALSAIQLLPLVELIGQSNRARPSIELASAYSMWNAYWGSFAGPVRPGFFVDWEQNLYAGGLVLIAGACGLCKVRDRDVRGLLLMSLVGGLVAAGNRTPAFGAFYHVLPGLSFFRLHSRAAALIAVALMLGAARFLSQPGGTKHAAPLVYACASGAIVWCWLNRVAVAGDARAQELVQRDFIRATAFQTAVLAACAYLVVAWARMADSADSANAARRRLPQLLLLVWALDVSHATIQAKKIYHPNKAFPDETLVLKAIADHHLRGEAGVPPRVSVPGEIVRANAGMAYDFSTFNAYYALSLDRVWTYIHRRVGEEAPVEDNIFPNARIFRHGPFPYPDMNLSLGVDPRTVELKANPEPDPRAYLCANVEKLDDWQKAIELLRLGHDFHHTALVEDIAIAKSMDGRDGGAAGTCRIVSFEPERLLVETDAPDVRLLVLKEAYYPGWRARIDSAAGADKPCVAANAWMRAVTVPAGKHSIEIYYQPSHWTLGVILSALALAALGLAWFFAPRATQIAKNHSESLYK